MALHPYLAVRAWVVASSMGPTVEIPVVPTLPVLIVVVVVVVLISSTVVVVSATLVVRVGVIIEGLILLSIVVWAVVRLLLLWLCV